MTEPVITTIIPTYRRPNLLKKAIESVLGQTISNFKVCICDNASNDETAQIVADFAKKDSRVHYYCHQSNIGMMENYKFGLSLVETHFFSFLSDDDILLPSFFEIALQEFEKYPDAGFVAGSTLIMRINGEIERVPLDEWPREGIFSGKEGVLEMIGKYPVPTSVLFRKKFADITSIDLENPFLWDPDFLLHIASNSSYVISKKPCAIFLHHDSSFSNAQDFITMENAFRRLIQRIITNSSLLPSISSEASNLIQKHLLHYRLSFFKKFLKSKRFSEARNVLELLKRTTDTKLMFFYYEFSLILIKTFPPVIYFVYILKYIKNKIKKRSNLKYNNLSKGIGIKFTK